MTAISTDRPQTVAEEIANAVSHGIGFLLAVASLPILLVFSSRDGHPVDIVSTSVFSVTMMLLYLVSTLYHAVPDGGFKRWLNRMDHAAIFLFIAGSYTPFVLGVLHGTWGWTLFGVVWGIAVVGMTLKLLNRLSHPLLSTGLYVAMGWVAIFAAGPLVQRMPVAGMAWLVAGGVAYTLGAIVFIFDSRFRFAHFTWHLFVLAGSTCHFFAALWYAH